MTRLTVTGLGIADAPGSFVTRAVPRLELVWGGLEGDRHFGLTMKAGVRQKHHPRGAELRNSRQLSILSEEELAQIAAELSLPRVDWQSLGGNLCVSGGPALTALKPSTRLLFPSGACLVVDGENLPCQGPGRILQAAQFVQAAHHRRGLVAWVERPGLLEVGNPIELIAP